MTDWISAFEGITWLQPCHGIFKAVGYKSILFSPQ